jgi:hypothetical protein
MEVGASAHQAIQHLSRFEFFREAKSRKLFKVSFGNNGHPLEVLKGYQLLGM